MMPTATAERKKAKEKKKRTIHEREGLGPMDIYQVERAFHPDAAEIVDTDLSDLTDDFFKEHMETRGEKRGHLKEEISADEATDEFLKKLGEYHFGEGKYKEHIDEGHQDFVKDELARVYGVSRRALKAAFKRGGYKNIGQFQEVHKTPMVERSVTKKREDAQGALDEYRGDEETREELGEHMQKRVGEGKPLTKTFLNMLPLEEVLPLITAYMGVDGALEKIEKNKRTSLGLSDTRAGHPDIYQSFEKGPDYVIARYEETKKVDTTHRLTSEKKKKVKK